MRKEFSPLKWAASHFQLTLSIGIATVLGVGGLLLSTSAGNQQAGLIAGAINDAQLVAVDNTGRGNGQKVAPNQVFPVIIAMSNTSKTKGVKLKSWQLGDYSIGIAVNAGAYGAAARTHVKSIVNQGGTEAFVIMVTAPATPGAYHIDFQMVQEYVQWFGPIVPIDFTVLPGKNDAVVNALSGIANPAYPGQKMSVFVQMTNAVRDPKYSAKTWIRGSTKLGITGDPSTYGPNAARTSLPNATAAAGEKINFLPDFTAPLKPGTYEGDFQMLEEGVEWFGEKAHFIFNVLSEGSKGINMTASSGQTSPNSFTFTQGDAMNIAFQFQNIGETVWSSDYNKNVTFAIDRTVAGNYLPVQIDGRMPFEVQPWIAVTKNITADTSNIVPGKYILPIVLYANGHKFGDTLIANIQILPDSGVCAGVTSTVPADADGFIPLQIGQKTSLQYQFKNTAKTTWGFPKYTIFINDSNTNQRPASTPPGATLNYNEDFVVYEGKPGTVLTRAISVVHVSDNANPANTKNVTATCVQKMKIVAGKYNSTAITEEMKIEQVVQNSWPSMQYADTKGVFTPGTDVMISGAFQNPASTEYTPTWYNTDVVMDIVDSRLNQSIRKIKIDGSVPPGGKAFVNHNFYGVYAIPANAQPGNYFMTLSLEYNGTKFGESYNIPYTIVAAKDDAKCVTEPNEMTVKAGTKFSLNYNFLNTGNTYFTPSTHNYRVMIDSTPYFTHNDVFIEKLAAPQDTASFMIPLTISTPGIYSINGKMSGGYNIKFGTACTTKVTVEANSAPLNSPGGVTGGAGMQGTGN